MKLKNAVVGQRVVAKCADIIGDILVGKAGVIVETDNSICPIKVKFDERFSSELHGEDGRCWWMYPHQIKKEK